MVRSKQRGSILNFVIIGSLLAALLVGGAYIVRHTLTPVSSGTPSSQDNDGSSEQPAGEGQGDPEETTPDGGQDTDNGEVLLPGGSSVGGGQTSSDDSPASLPQTGPEGALLQSFIIGAVVAAAVTYMRSRNLSGAL